MTYLLLIIGFIGLIKGADILISGSFFIANLLRIPKVIVGLTIVALGASLPETSISIIASLNHNTELAVNNILGSNFFNVLMIIGVCSMIKNISVTDENILKRDFPVLIFFYVLNCIFFWNGVNKAEGILLVVLFGIYFSTLVRYAVNNKVEDQEGLVASRWVILKNILFILLGGICIKFCGDLVVDNAGEIAKSFGLNSAVVGFSLVAVGAGLPDLVMSMVALRKNQNEIVLGSVIGTNIVNSTFTIGVSACFTPIFVDKKIFLNLLILLLATILVFIFCKKQNKITHQQGLVLIAIYISYTFYLFC